jgi:hypothetical protein
MSFTLFAGIPLRESGYQPRHSSTRRARGGSGRPAQAVRGKASRGRAGQPEPPQLADLVSVSETPGLLDGLTYGQIRKLLEACASDDYVRAVPEIAYLIAHPSHTVETLTAAWDAFREATRDAHALRNGTRYWWEFFGHENLGSAPADRAAKIKVHLAGDAWGLIVNGARGAW